MRMCYTHRRIFVQLASNLLAEGDTKKAKEVLTYLDKNIPSYNVPLNYMSGSLDEARVYSALGEKKKAMEIFKTLWKNSEQYLLWYCSLDGMRFLSSQRECVTQLYVMQQIVLDSEEADAKWSEAQAKRLNSLVELYHGKGGRFGSEEE